MRLDMSELFRTGIPVTNWKGTKVLTKGNFDFVLDRDRIMWELVKFPDEIRDWIPEAKRNIIVSEIKNKIFSDLKTDKVLRATLGSDISMEAYTGRISQGIPVYIIYGNKLFRPNVLGEAQGEVLYPY